MTDFLKPAGQAKFIDRHVTKMNELLKNETGPSIAEYGLIGAPLSKPSISHSGASLAPGTIRESMGSYSSYANHSKQDLGHVTIHDFGDITMHPTNIEGSQERITESVTDVIQGSRVENLFILGGDHSITFPTLKALKKKYGKIGVIQFDAHHDLRNLEDGGPTNGTPFRRAIENKVLKGDHLVQIGIRDFTNARNYDDYANKQGVTVHTMQDVHKQGMEALIQNALYELSKKCKMIYLSVDMDVLDQAFAPGCPAIGPGGMDSYTLLAGVEQAARHPSVQGMDIVEIDPTIDFRNMTSRVAAHVLFSYLKGKEF